MSDAVDDEAFMPMNCRFAKITVRMLGADAPMTSNVTRTNNGKLLAAVAVIALALCVCVAAVPTDSSDAEPKYPAQASDVSSYEDLIKLNDREYWNSSTNTFTVPAAGLIINLTGDVGSADSPVNMTIDLDGDLKIISSEGHSIYINYQATVPGQKTVTFTSGETFVLENANAYLEISKAAGYTDNDDDSSNDSLGVFGSNMDITVTGKSTLTVTQGSTVNGATAQYGGKLTITGANAVVDFNKANAISGTTLNMTSGATLKFTNPNTVAGALQGTVNASFIKVTGMSESEKTLNFYSLTLTNGSQITSDGKIGIYEASTINADDKSEVSADKGFQVEKTKSSDSGPEIKGGTWNGDWSSNGGEKPTFGDKTTVNGTSDVEVPGWTVRVYDEATKTNTYYTNSISTMTIKEGQSIILGTVDPGYSLTVTTEKTGSVIVLTTDGDEVSYMRDTKYASGLYIKGSVESFTESSNTTVTGASVSIEDLADDVQIVGAAALGSVDIANTIVFAKSGSADSVLIVPTDSEAMFVTNGKTASDNPVTYSQGTIVMDNGDLWVYGKFLTSTGVVNNKSIIVYTETAANVNVFATNVNAVQPFCTEGIAVKEITAKAITVKDIDELRDALKSSLPIVINGDIDVKSGQLDIVGKTINITGGNGFEVYSGATLNIEGSTIDQENDAKIVAQQGSKLVISDSKVFMVVDADKKASVEVYNDNVTYDNTTSNVKVGYGTVLTLSGTPTDDVQVYGTLVIEGTVTIGSNITMTVYQGANLDLAGTVNVAGTVKFNVGSTAVISGTMTVTNTDGDASIISSGDVTVTGTLTVNASSANSVLDNYLTITEVTENGEVVSGDFIIEGTLNMYATLSGTVQDKGVVNINGEIAEAGAEVMVYQDITLTVVSVTGGKLTVTDGDYTTETYSNVSAGNAIVLDEVKGVTVTASVTTGSYVDANEKTQRYTLCYLDVSGTATAVKEGVVSTIEICGATVQANTAYDKVDGITKKTGTVTVSDALIIGKDVKLNIKEGTVDVSGTVTATVADSLNTSNQPIIANKVTMGTKGVLTVTGQVTTKTLISGGNINAARYAVTDNTGNNGTTYYYTSFDAAISVVGDADLDTIYVSGKVTANTSADVANGMIISMDRNSTLVIADGVTVTIQTGAKLTGASAKVEVEGTLTAQNHKEDVNTTVVADVVRDNGTARTWTSLATALEGAQDGDIITLAKDVTLTSNTEIPAGVTVQSSYDLDTGKYTLTVNGTYSADEDGNLTIGTDGEAIANGVIVLTSIGDADEDARLAALEPIDGAHFTLYDGADVSYYVTNLAYAAENVQSGTIRVIGSVSGGDIAFNQAADEAKLRISIETRTGTDVVNTVVSVGSIDLNGAILCVDEKSRFSGTVTAPYGDGTADATFQLSSVSDILIDSQVVEGVDADTYYAYIFGVGAGTVVVESGTATIGGDNYIEASLLIMNDTTFTVSEGATLTVPEGFTLYGGVDAKGDDLVVIDGTVEFNEGSISGSVTVNGTMSVSEDLNIPRYTTINLSGNLNVAEDKTLTVAGGVIANNDAVISGDVNIDTYGYILAYPATDLSDASIDWETATGSSSAKTTQYYVNGELYATAYADANNMVGIYDVLDPADIKLSGYSAVGGWFETNENAEEAISNPNYDGDGHISPSTTAYVGSAITEQVYGAANVATVTGQISEGTGLTIYIDGLTIYSYAGTYGYELSVGTHVISITADAQYSIENAVITFNGQTIENNGTITITSDMNSFTLAASGATPADTTVVIDGGNGGSDMGLTDYLLIVLVILIVIMAIIVALRLMRS